MTSVPGDASDVLKETKLNQTKPYLNQTKPKMKNILMVYILPQKLILEIKVTTIKIYFFMVGKTVKSKKD